MNKIIIYLFSIFPIIGFSQNEDCFLSDSNYHYQVIPVFDEVPPVDFDKTDFINHLIVNSNISGSEISFLNENIIEVIRLFYFEDDYAYLHLISLDDSLISYFNNFSESIQQVSLYCDCEFSDDLYRNYARLITDMVPSADFDKEDFIEHLIANSNPTASELDFLNNSITEVYMAFPSSQVGENRKVMIVVSNYDLMLQYLLNFLESINRVEFICGEPELSINENLILSNEISIIPNPVVENSKVIINSNISVEQVFIYDLSGKLLVKKEINNSHTIMLNEFNLNSGLYFMKFFSKGKHTVKKIIVK